MERVVHLGTILLGFFANTEDSKGVFFGGGSFELPLGADHRCRRCPRMVSRYWLYSLLRNQSRYGLAGQ